MDINELVDPGYRLSEESKEKICIIADIVSMGKLLKRPIPNVRQFDILYEAKIRDLELLQYDILRQVSQLPGMEDLQKRLVMDWDGTSSDF